MLGFLFLLSSVQGTLMSLSQLKSAFQNFTSYSSVSYSSDSFTYIKISTPGIQESMKTSILLASGIYAGYTTNIDFLLNFTSSLLESLNSSDPSVSTMMESKILYILPVINEAAYTAMYNYSSNSSNSMIFQTDETLLANCNGSLDAGVNIDHNFPYSWSSEGAYGQNCSANYAGVSSSSAQITRNLVNFLSAHNIVSGGLLHFNLANNTYLKPFLCNTGTVGLNNYQEYLYETLGNFVPQGFSLTTLTASTGNPSYGTFTDYAASSGIAAIEIGVQDTYNKHQAFIYDFIKLIDVNFTISYKDCTFNVVTTQLGPNSTASIEYVILSIEIDNAAALNITSLEVKLQVALENSEAFTYESASLTTSTKFNSTETDSLMGFSNSSTGFFDVIFTYNFYAFSSAVVVYNLSRMVNIGNPLTGSIQLLPGSVYVSAEVFNFTTGSGSGGSGSSSSSSGMSNTDKNKIIAASMVLIAINIAVIVTAFIWKICKGSKEDDRNPEVGVPTFNPKAPGRV